MINLLIGIFTAAGLMVWLHGAALRWVPAWLWAIGLVLWAAVQSVLTVAWMGGGFGPGVIMFCTAAPISMLSLGYVVARSHDLGKTMAPFTYWLLGLMLVAGQAAPVWGSTTLERACMQRTTERAAPLIAAVQQYTAAHKAPPTHINQVVPAYLPAAPEMACQWIWRGARATEPEFRITACTWQEQTYTVIYTDTPGRVALHRYAVEAETWSRISFLDGVCSFLP